MLHWVRSRRHLLLRVTVAVVVALVVIVIPLPTWTPQFVVWFQVPIVVFLLICYLGKLLYDTLFFDRAPW